VYGPDALRELEEYLDPNVLNDEEFTDPNLPRGTNENSMSGLQDGDHSQEPGAQSMGNWAPGNGKISTASSPAGPQAKTRLKARDDMTQPFDAQIRRKAGSKAGRVVKGKKVKPATDLFMMSVKVQGPVPAHGYGVSDKRGDLRPTGAPGQTVASHPTFRQSDKANQKQQGKNPYVNDHQLP
jgi:hypothetical protein